MEDYVLSFRQLFDLKKEGNEELLHGLVKEEELCKVERESENS